MIDIKLLNIEVDKITDPNEKVCFRAEETSSEIDYKKKIYIRLAKEN